MIRLVLSCGLERYIDPMVLDAYDVTEGETGWCHEHSDATIDAIFAEDGDDIKPVPRHAQ